MVVKRVKKAKKLAKLNDKTFSFISADPNWLYNKYGQKGHGAAKDNYEESSIEQIMDVPVSRWCRKDTILMLWGTCPKVDLAVDTWRAWGFNLVTSIPWVKTMPPSEHLAKGIGFWFRGCAEMVYFCRRGPKGRAPKYLDMADKPDGLLVGEKEQCVFYARRGPHSRKPLALIDWVESHFKGPYLELWATGKRPGWETWGHGTGFHLSDKGVEVMTPEALLDAHGAPLRPRRAKKRVRRTRDQGML